jgi:DNA uptake protein ComE-like DNA-binding protein
MLVNSAYAEGVQESNQSNKSDTEIWALPVLRSGKHTMLDLRLTDCFRTGTVVPDQQKPTYITTAGSYAETGISDSSSTERKIATQVPCDTDFGLINLNTAPPAILAALPGMSESLVDAIYITRVCWLHPQQDASIFRAQGLSNQDPQWWMSVHPNSEPCWNNLSDFLLDDELWQERPLYDRLDAVYPFYQLLTTHSQSLRVISANRQPLQDTSDETENEPTRLTYTRAERIITSDRGSVETVSFRFLDQQNLLKGDPDLRYAIEAPTADKSYIDEIKRFDPYLSSTAAGAYTDQKVSQNNYSGSRK